MGAKVRWMARCAPGRLWVGAAATLLAIGAGTLGGAAAALPASAAPLHPAVMARPRVAGNVAPVIPRPVAANAAFAATRGADYEAALAAARQHADQLAPAVRPGSNVTTATWTPLGPAPMEPSASPNSVNYGGANAGRVTGLAVAPSGELYAAAAGGGVWSSTDNGTTWATNTDSQPDIAMGAVAVDTTDPSVVFGGTGEDNQCGDCFYGDGILESFDGGTSWTTSNPGGVFTGLDISSIAFVPGATSIGATEVLVGTSNGLFVSTDGGTTWSQETATATTGIGWVTGNVTSIVVNSETPTPTIYVGVAGQGIEVTTDNGARWTVDTSTSGLTGATSSASIALALVPATSAASDTLYASLGGATSYLGLFQSTDGGTSWTQLSNVPAFTTDNYAFGSGSGDQSSYDNAIAVDPGNPDILVVGGITAVEGIDNGGTWTWTNLNSGTFDATGVTNQFHPDFHAVTFDGSGDLYVGNDGGVWELPATAVNSATPAFRNLNGNLDITQFYAGMGVYGNGSQILAGSQDNGTPLYSSTNTQPTVWQIEDTGDGGSSVIDPADSSIQYAEADIGLGGSLDMTTDGWKTSSTVMPAGLTFADFTAPLTVEPGATPRILLGGNDVFESTLGQSTTANWTALGVPGSDPSGNNNIAAIAVAPSDPSVLYAARDDGSVALSSDGGATWTSLAPPVLAETVPTHLAVSPTDPYTVYVTYAASSAGGNAAAGPAVLVGSGLGGATPVWTNLTGDLPATIPTNAVLPDGAGGLVVANDAGVFLASTLNGTSTTWSPLGAGLPNVQVVDLALAPDGSLFAETHGRGIWSLPFDQLAVTTEPPASVSTGQSFTVNVAVEDAAGTVVSDDSARPVTLAIAGGTGSPGATLSCTTNPVDDTNGVAGFQCSVGVAGSGYQLTASSAGLASVSSTPFTVAAPVVQTGGGGGGQGAPAPTGPPPATVSTSGGAPPQGPVSVVGRLYGQQAIDTAIAVSRQAFPQPASVKAVVLASASAFADELSAGPLAAHVGGPLLLTGGAGATGVLDPRAAAEIQRVLAPGGTVYVVGGDLALPASIDATLQKDGYVVHRIAGTTAAATAVDVAEALGNPSTVFEVTDTAPWDGIAAAPAAISTGGAILLTNGPTQAPETAAYLKAHPGDTRFAIGGRLAAAGADPSATAVDGATAEATSAAVAARFFPAPSSYGAASTLDFQDGLVGGLYMASGGRSGPILLVDPGATPPLDPAVVSYLRTLAAGTPGTVFGGPLAFPLTDVSQLQVYAGVR